MIRVALKMLRGVPAKYAMPISGICFSTILMVQGLALGIDGIRLNYAAPTNIRAPIFGATPLVESLGGNQPLRALGDEPNDQTLADLVEAGEESKRSAHTHF
ncbi:hypothetical protein OH491_19320 [Termitidicoccus mucosus]|uniref:Uncharacterized protein n=1 Tax=Termitidicoccus mucosus TaxID=1184151 RepID=A0A178IG30_9BACT|nr:hypothetical protein AW736_09340 [Opitutaceae bacterium TSB47]